MPETVKVATVSTERPFGKPEQIKTAEADGLQARAASLFKNPQTRILRPSYRMREADVQHTDPTKKLIATQDAASNTTFLIESYPVEGTADARYTLIKWKKNDPSLPDQGVAGGWLRVVSEPGKDPYIGLARHADKFLDGILPHGRYIGDQGGSYKLGDAEIRELSPEALQDVLTRLNSSQVSSELTEKFWQLAEQKRLLDEVVGISMKVSYGTHWAGNIPDRWKVWYKAFEYEHELDKQYIAFSEKYHLPHRELLWKPASEPTEIDKALARGDIAGAMAIVDAWYAAHPTGQIDTTIRRYAAAEFERWLGREGKAVIGELGVAAANGITESMGVNTQQEQEQMQENQLLLKEQELLAAIEAWKHQRNPNNNHELEKMLEEEVQTLPETIELAKIYRELGRLREKR